MEPGSAIKEQSPQLPSTPAGSFADLGPALAALIMGILCLSLLVITSDVDRLAASPLLQSGAVLAALAALGLLIVRPKWIFLSFLVACMVIPHELEAIVIPAGFMKIYPQDIVFALNLCILTGRMLIGRQVYKPIFFNRYMMVHIGLGVVALCVGLFLFRHPFNDTLGDFRRAYFYVLNYFVAIGLVDEWKDVVNLRRALLLGAAFAVLRGLMEIAGGQFVFRRFGDAAHVLTHFETTFLMFIVFYGITQLLFRPGAATLFWSIVSGLGVLVIVIANFRACWLGFFSGLGSMLLFMPGRFRTRLLFVSCIFAVILSLGIAAMWEVQVSESRTTLGEELLLKADLRKTTSDINVTWRFQSYQNALRQWQSSPIIGTGIGEVLDFFTTSSSGSIMLAQGHRVHNSLLWYFMTLGVAGFSIFLYVQLKLISSLVKFIRSSRWIEGKTTAIACLAFYFSLAVTSFFEILLESAMPVTVISSMIALAVLTIHYHRPDADITSPQPPVHQ